MVVRPTLCHPLDCSPSMAQSPEAQFQPQKEKLHSGLVPFEGPVYALGQPCDPSQMATSPTQPVTLGWPLTSASLAPGKATCR